MKYEHSEDSGCCPKKSSAKKKKLGGEGGGASLKERVRSRTKTLTRIGM